MKIVDQIKTERLLLRGIDETDTEEIVLWRSNPEVYRYFKSPHKITREEHTAWYNSYYLYDMERFDWICIEQKTGTKIGVFGLTKKEQSAEVNYMLSSEAQHKGYATEAIAALIEYANTKWNTERITAEVHRDNSPSIALALKLGFQKNESCGNFYIYTKVFED